MQAAETGSGKTGAFCLPVLQIVFESHRARAGAEQQKKQNVGMVACVMNVRFILLSLTSPVCAQKWFSDSEDVWAPTRP